MRTITKGFTLAAAAAVLITGLIAGSARFAQAQSAEKQGELGGPGVAAEPDAKAPINVNGCWSGTLDDVYAGSGEGYADFAQSGKHLLPPADADMVYFVWTDSYAYGDGKGVATAKAFHLAVKFGKGCVEHVSGKLEGGDLVGVYSFTHACAKQPKGDEFGKHKGSFNFTFDPTGDSCD
jgi:hypothetical protein